MFYDDGSSIETLPDGTTVSTDTTGYSTSDPLPSPLGWTVFSPNDAAEAAKMSQAYPQNGQNWWDNAAMLGISRLVDTTARAYTTYKGSMPASYAGQNGATYASGPAVPASVGGIPIGLLILGGLALLAFSHHGG